MKALLLLVAVGVTLAPAGAAAGVVTVDCEGSGMYTDLRAAILASGADDTVLVSPCVYFADPGSPPSTLWPVVLDADSPTIMSTDGAEVTVIEGDGTIPAFAVEPGASVRIHGFTFRTLTSVLYKEDLWPAFDLQFTENIIEYCEAGLDVSSTSASSLIARNAIRHNGGGIFPYGSSATIEENEISHCWNGITTTGGTDAQILDNYIHDTENFGIDIGEAGTYAGNLLENNPWGVWTDGGEAILTENVIRNNTVGVYYVGSLGIQSSHFECNDIYDNELYGVRVNDAAEGPFDATMNWWGTTDPTAIAGAIYDCVDNPSISVCVAYDPWADAPGCNGSPVDVRSWGSIRALYR